MLFRSVWAVCVNLLASFNTIASALLVYLLYKAVELSWQIWTAGFSTFGAIFVCALLQGRLGWVVSSFPSFFWMSPMLLLVVPIYSLCNLHDVSWGTREAHASAAAEADARKRDTRFREFRSKIVLAWIFFNLVLTQLLLLFSGGISGSNNDAAASAADGGGGSSSSSSSSGSGTNTLGVSSRTSRLLILFYICGIAGICGSPWCARMRRAMSLT